MRQSPAGSLVPGLQRALPATTLIATATDANAELIACGGQDRVLATTEHRSLANLYWPQSLSLPAFRINSVTIHNERADVQTMPP